MPVRRLVLVAFLVASCAATHLTDVWRDPNYRGPPLRRIVVFALTRDVTARRILEDQFSKKLATHEVTPIPSYTLLPGEGRPTDQQVHDALHASNADGALLTHLVGVQQQSHVVAGYLGPGPYLWGGPYFAGGPFYPDYFGTWGLVYAPGYLDTDTVVRLTTRLYTTEGEGHLVWSGDSDTMNPSSVRDLASDAIATVVGELTRVKLIPEKP